jgi:hypothetical protein
MTKGRVRFIFLAILLAVPLAVVAWDVWLYSVGGTEMTISWSMATAPRIVIFAVGFVAGAVIWGLAAHFWTTMPDPAKPLDTPKARVEMALGDKAEAFERFESTPHPAPGVKYRHYKGGKYVVVAVGLKEDTLEPMVAYCDAGHHPGRIWFRSLANFTEPVHLADGEVVPRFVPIG